METKELPVVDETTNPDDHQHAVHDCQMDLLFSAPVIIYPAIAMCGVTVNERLTPGPKRPKCPKCVALQGTVTTCPGCGQTGVM